MKIQIRQQGGVTAITGLNNFPTSSPSSDYLDGGDLWHRFSGAIIGRSAANIDNDAYLRGG